MEKEPRRLVLRATPAIFLISLLLLYFDTYGSSFSQSDQWTRIYSSTGARNKPVEDHVSDELSSLRTINELESQLNRVVDDHESETEVNGTDDLKLPLQSKEATETVADVPELQLSNKETDETVVEQEPQTSEVYKTRSRPKSTKTPLSRLVRGDDLTELAATGFACDRAEHSVVCVADKPVSIDTNTMTVFVPTDKTADTKKTSEVRPYARQEDADLLQHVTPVRLVQGNETPPACQYTHDVPAVIFSSSGFTGNLFHEFNEIIIPLFITTRHLRSQAQFIVVDYKPSFVNKYSRIMSRLSVHRVLNPAANRSVHCFSGAIAGLRFHDFLAVNSSEIPGGYSMPDFKQFLRKTYNLKVTNVSEIRRPALMLISRTGTRRFLNEGEMVSMMKGLGFEVIVVKKPERMSNLNKFARVVSRCSVLVGTHGAGLANELFLPAGAVTVQVEPLGLEWPSTSYFGIPAASMGVHYLRYKIEAEESSLLGKYGAKHPVIIDPASIFAQGYQAARAVYLDQQNIKVNVSRFRETLTEALRLMGRSAPLPIPKWSHSYDLNNERSK